MMAESEAALLDEAARALLLADRRILLLQRLAPPDIAAESARLTRAYTSGRALSITQGSDQTHDLAGTRRALARVQALAAPLGALGLLHAERAAELELEARLVEALGTPRFRELAAERFPAPPAALSRECEGFVTEALALTAAAPVSLHRSDDEADPASLWSRLRVRARELHIELRIERAQNQLATAATGEGLVVLRPGVMLSAPAAERIAAHELFAHALPRARARYASCALFRAGTRGATDEEEGRAILVEQRAGLLDAERRTELAWRHVAALGVRRGAEPRETVTSLVSLGAPLARAVDIALRVHRGGGLARELVYLPAFFAVRRAFSSEPGLERWFERGRIGLVAARLFSRAPLQDRPSRPAPACDRRASAGAAGPRRFPLA